MTTYKNRRFRPSLDMLPQRLAPTGIIFPPMPATGLDETLTVSTPAPVIAPPPVVAAPSAYMELLATTRPEHCL